MQGATTMVLRYIACAHNDNKGEQITRIFLMDALADTDGILLGNYHLPMNTSTLECDFVLFNQRGVWIIEVKNWRGRIDIDQVNWQRDDGAIIHSPLQSVEIKAKKLHSILLDLGFNLGFKDISVAGLVVLTQKSAILNNTDTDDIRIREPHEDKVFYLDDRLIRALNGRHYLHDPDNNKDLRPEYIQQIVKRLLPLKVDPDRERIGDSYRILSDLGPSPNKAFHAYKAVHVKMHKRYARAKKYSTHDAHSTGELRHFINDFQRDMQALMKMEDHPNIVQVFDYLSDRDNNDVYWLLLEWITGITLQDALDMGLDMGLVLPFQEQLRILKAIVNGLDGCHNHDILHRNLTPSCIYLTNDGTAKIGDFDFARVPTNLMKTITITGQPLPVKVNRHMAPELRVNARLADERSDLYALGAIWYDMLFPSLDPDEDINLAQLEKTDLPSDARELLSKLLATNPKERPQRAQAVKRWLEQI
jgi:serine/threonine protein kinase